jgi:hypothetical protein
MCVWYLYLHHKRAMLHIMSQCIAERESKNTFFEVSVVHIDESAAIGLSDDEVSRYTLSLALTVLAQS